MFEAGSNFRDYVDESLHGTGGGHAQSHTAGW